MINLQNVQSIFCDLSSESIDNIDNLSHYITVAIAGITSRILPNMELSNDDLSRLEMACGAYAFYLYCIANDVTPNNFKVGDISVSGSSLEKATLVRDSFLSLCSDLLLDNGEFLFSQVRV